MRAHVFALIVAGMALLGTPAWAQVHVTIAGGNVTVSARDATIRQILTEWARVGQTRIVNLDRLSGAPMSLELTNIPEAQALETVLRSIDGGRALAERLHPMLRPAVTQYVADVEVTSHRRTLELIDITRHFQRAE